MNTKHALFSLASLALLGFLTTLCFAQNYQVTFAVTEDGTKSVEGASVRVFTYSHTVPGDAFGKDVFTQSDVTTDASGKAVLQASSRNGEIAYSATLAGFYPTRGIRYRFSDHRDGQWLPWSPTLRLELRRIIAPIPLMVKRVGHAGRKDGRLPEVLKPAGYDLEKGDWVAPHGQGVHADLLFQIHGRTQDLTVPYESRFELTFSHPLDGLILYESPPFDGSALHMPHRAPESGYLPRLVKRQALIIKPDNIIDNMERIVDHPVAENYFLRVRTQTDDQGRITSAHYAKVYRGFTWYPNGSTHFHYYFNPQPNDPNLEFDPTRNLFPKAWGTEIGEP